MLKYEKTILLVDLLFDDDQIGDDVKSIQIDSPYQQMLLDGVLTETVQDEKLYVSFTVERYFHYVLGTYLYQQAKRHISLFELIDSLLENKLNGLKEGIGHCLSHFIEANQNDFLPKFIDNYPQFAVSSVQALAKNIELNGDDLLIQILAEKSESDFIVIKKVVEYFEYSGKPKFNKAIAAIILTRVTPSTILEFSLCAGLSKHYEKENVVDLYDRTMAFFNSYDFRSNQEIKITIGIVLYLGREILRYSEKKLALAIYEFGYNLTLGKDEFKKDHLTIYGHVAHQLKSTGKTKEATEKYIDIIKRLKENNNFVLAAQNILRLSEAYKQANRLPEALDLAKEAHEIMLNNNGKIHLLTASSSGYVGSIYIYLEDWVNAEPMIQHSMEVRAKLLGEFNTKVCIPYINLATIYMHTDRIEKAEELLLKALGIREKRFGRIHQDVATTIYELANLRTIENKLGEALKLHLETLEIRKSKLGTVHYFTNKSRLALASLYKQLNLKEDFIHISSELIENCKGDNIENATLINSLKELS
jgi:tetratricopeptide (TPR) repeat protein